MPGGDAQRDEAHHAEATNRRPPGHQRKASDPSLGGEAGEWPEGSKAGRRDDDQYRPDEARRGLAARRHRRVPDALATSEALSASASSSPSSAHSAASVSARSRAALYRSIRSFASAGSE